MATKNNFPKKILQAMRAEVYYDPEELALMTAIPIDTVNQTLQLMDRHGLIDSEGPKFRKGSKVRTRQGELFR